MHICTQVEESNALADCFPTERRNNLFKQDVAPKLNKLAVFEQAALLRLARTDLQIQTSFSLEPALGNPRHDATLAQQLGVATALCSKSILYRAGALSNDFVYILAPDLAVNLTCWVQLKNDCFGLCRKVHRSNDDKSCQKSWRSVCNSVWKTTQENVLIPCKLILHTSSVSWSLKEGDKLTLLH